MANFSNEIYLNYFLVKFENLQTMEILNVKEIPVVLKSLRKIKLVVV